MVKMLLGLSTTALLLGPILLAAAAGGCGPTRTSAICDALCTCTPCTDNDRADCESSADNAEQKAQPACSAQFDAYLTCAQDNVRCHDPAALNTKCEAAITKLVQCDNTIPIIGTPCDASQIKTQVCLGNFSGGSFQGKCTGQQACTAQCVNAASCVAVKDVYSGASGPAGQPLVDCFTKCASPQGQ